MSWIIFLGNEGFTILARETSGGRPHSWFITAISWVGDSALVTLVSMVGSMRFHLLDKLICSRCGNFSLRLNTEELLYKVNTLLNEIYHRLAHYIVDIQVNPLTKFQVIFLVLLVSLHVSSEVSCFALLVALIIQLKMEFPILEEQMITWVNKEWWEKNYRIQRVSSLIKSIERIRSRVQGSQGVLSRWYERDRYLFFSLR
jgi:hypothetical protein